MAYRDETASFDELLAKDGSVTIHHRNLQCLAIEIFKVYKGVAPSMSDVFGMEQNVNSENVSANTRSDKTFYCSLKEGRGKRGLFIYVYFQCFYLELQKFYILYSM